MSRFVAIDFETATYAADSACALGVVAVEDGRVTERQIYRIRPPGPQFDFTHIHGLTWRDVMDAPDFGEQWDTIREHFKEADFIAAHNSTFDRRVLEACCARHGVDAPARDYVCTVRVARATWDLRPARLPNVCAFLGIELDHHDALSDAHACARIVMAAEEAGWSRETGFGALGERYTAPW